MKWLGLTGGIACGKSTVSSLLREHGIPVLDADEVAKIVVKPGSPGLQSVVQVFGPGILEASGSLDRRRLGQIVFGDKAKLRLLESITHPLIREEIDRQRQVLQRQGAALAIYDVPLLFESQSEKQFEKVIVVSCTQQQQRARLRQRTGWSDTEIENRIAAQIPLTEKESKADFIIHNDGDADYLKKEVQRLLSWLNTIVH